MCLLKIYPYNIRNMLTTYMPCLFFHILELVFGY